MLSVQDELLILELRRLEVSHNRRRPSRVEDSPGRTWGSGWRAAQRNLCRTLHLQDYQNRTSSSAMDPPPPKETCASIATTNSTWQGSLRRSGVVASLGGGSQNAPRKASTCAYCCRSA